MIALEIEDAIAKGPEQVFDALFRQITEGDLVFRRLNNDFVGADPVHVVVNAVALPVQIPFDAQSWKLVGHDAKLPGSTVDAIGKNLGRRAILVARAERASPATPRQHL